MHLTSFLSPYKKQVILGPLCKFVETVFELIMPILMATLIDVGIKQNKIWLIVVLSISIFGLAVLGFLIAVLGQHYAVSAAQGFGTALRKKVFEHITNFSYSELDRFSSSSLTTRLTSDINQLQYSVMMILRLVLRAPFLCIGSLVGAFIIDWHLALIMLISVPAAAVVLYFLINISIKAYKTVQKKLDNISLLASENLTGIRVIKAFGQTNSQKQKFFDSGDEHAHYAQKAGWLASLSNPLAVLILNISLLVIIYLGGKRVYFGKLSQGEIIIFINYISQIVLALNVLVNLMLLITKALASAARVNEVLDTIPKLTDEGQVLEQFPQGDIVFQNVSFRYGDGKEVLKNINLTIPKGTTFGIVGLTGSGKTTLVNLIARFYDVLEGKITIGGQDIKELSQKFLREHIGIVPQKAVLFSGSIRDNLKMGRDVDDEKIMQALKIAQADFVNKLPDGLDYQLEQGGTNLSGGQRARLTIARALIMSPEILILDDSASALDFATERNLSRALKQHSTGRTVITISQRAGSLKNADIIAVLSEGQVVGLGTHDELIKSNQLYRDIYNTQLDIEGGRNE
ncbi:MAG TPA: ABC transporter ATP-binding protein [Clostridia bacterium]